MRLASLLFITAFGCSSTDASPPAASTTDSGPSGNHTSDGGADSADDASTPSYQSVVDEYLLGWNAATADERAAHREKAFAVDLVYADPNISGQGRDAFGATIEGLLSGSPSTRFVRRSGLQSLPGEVRFAFEIGVENQTPIVSGTDYASVGDDGKIVTLVTYVGALPAAAPLPAPIQSLLDAWSKTDATARGDSVTAAVSDDVVLVTTKGRELGASAVRGFVEAAHTADPTTTWTATSGLDTFADRFRVGVTVHASDTSDGVLTGALGTDGKIRYATLYLGPLPSL